MGGGQNNKQTSKQKPKGHYANCTKIDQLKERCGGRGRRDGRAGLLSEAIDTPSWLWDRISEKGGRDGVGVGGWREVKKKSSGTKMGCQEKRRAAFFKRMSCSLQLVHPAEPARGDLDSWR